MQKVFYNILLPVCPEKDPGPVMERAVAFANQLECNLHIFPVLSPVSSFLEFVGLKRWSHTVSENMEKIQSLHAEFLPKTKPGTLLLAPCKTENIAGEITAYAIAHNIDMIYYDGEMNGFANLPVDLEHIAGSQCSVMVDTMLGNSQKLESIVLPIDEHLSVNRIRVAIFMAQQLGATIHLVSSDPDRGSGKSMLYLKKAYQLLRDNTSIEVVCSSINGDGAEQSTFRYAASVQAGLIVSPMNRTPRHRNILQRLLPADWFNKPRIPVMLVD